MPSGEDGVLRVVSVAHVLAPATGFRTALAVEAAA